MTNSEHASQRRCTLRVHLHSLAFGRLRLQDCQGTGSHIVTLPLDGLPVDLPE